MVLRERLRGLGGASVGKTIFTCVYMGEKISRTSRPISIKQMKVQMNHSTINAQIYIRFDIV
jgi:hypothetical protein